MLLFSSWEYKAKSKFWKYDGNLQKKNGEKTQRQPPRKFCYHNQRLVIHIQWDLEKSCHLYQIFQLSRQWEEKAWLFCEFAVVSASLSLHQPEVTLQCRKRSHGGRLLRVFSNGSFLTFSFFSPTTGPSLDMSASPELELLSRPCLVCSRDLQSHNAHIIMH